MEAGVRILGSAAPVTLAGNVLLGSLDASTVLVDGSGHSIVGNLALGTTKVGGRSRRDMRALWGLVLS